MLSVGHKSEQRGQIDPRRKRVDRNRLLGAGNLHEAQNRPIGPLAHEFGVDRNKARANLPLAKAC